VRSTGRGRAKRGESQALAGGASRGSCVCVRSGADRWGRSCQREGAGACCRGARGRLSGDACLRGVGPDDNARARHWTPGVGRAGRVALSHPTGGVAGAVCAEGACPREALAGRGGRTLQVGPRRARACACARAGASAGRGCGAGPAYQWRGGKLPQGERERTGVLLYTLLKPMLMSSDAKKMWSGARTCAGANSIKNGFIVLVSSPRQPRQLPLTACLRPGKKKH